MQEPIQGPAKSPWHEVSKEQHYWLQVDAMTKPMGTQCKTETSGVWQVPQVRADSKESGAGYELPRFL